MKPTIIFRFLLPSCCCFFQTALPLLTMSSVRTQNIGQNYRVQGFSPVSCNQMSINYQHEQFCILLSHKIHPAVASASSGTKWCQPLATMEMACLKKKKKSCEALNFIPFQITTVLCGHPCVGKFQSTVFSRKSSLLNVNYANSHSPFTGQGSFRSVVTARGRAGRVRAAVHQGTWTTDPRHGCLAPTIDVSALCCSTVLRLAQWTAKGRWCWNLEIKITILFNIQTSMMMTNGWAIPARLKKSWRSTENKSIFKCVQKGKEGGALIRKRGKYES